jgi:CTP:molybdopterin cytidylyltransferase MocA
MVAAVVLAAGAATRYGSPKQQVLLPSVLAALRDARVDHVVVVQGAYPLETPGAELVDCPHWADGPGASLRCGLAALPPEVTHALVVLADGPELDPRAVERMVEHRGDGDVLAATYDGTRSHPVVLARAVWDAVPDDGARALTPLLINCSDFPAPGDIDFPLQA